ncbi:MAG: trypsin-like peptidase domain-containing protein [Hyphomicrobiaceae bacterium]|nr:trypsin-like peptidase domain-containing protein [Hyphomicrobiaceae bacterium]
MRRLEGCNATLRGALRAPIHWACWNALTASAVAVAALSLVLIVMAAPADAREAGATRGEAANVFDTAMQSVVSVLPHWPPDARRAEEPEASGIVWRDGRHVVTALHVVAKALSVDIRTRDGDTLPAQIVGRDPATDIAVLRVESDLPPAVFRAREPAIGEKACAAGNAFGLGLSLSCGVVSAVRRAGVGFNPIEDFVQTDAAVNPGSSGGALLDGEGQVIGLLSAIFTKTSDANIGVNFAVSARLLERVAGDIAKHGRPRRARSGLIVAPASGNPRGPVVRSVPPGSPAARADLAVGDIVLSVNGRRVLSPAEVMAEQAVTPVPGLMSLDVVRNGGKRTIEVELFEPKADDGRGGATNR